MSSFIDADYAHISVDNNYKTSGDMAVGCNLALFSDNFGSISASQWTDGALGIRTEGGTVSKASNKCRITRNAGSTEKSRYTGLVFGNFDYYITLSRISTSGTSYFGFWCFVDINNRVSIYYEQNTGLIKTVSVVGGSSTAGSTFATVSNNLSFRINRTGNVFTFYYDAAGGTSWTQLWQVTAAIGTTSRLSMTNWGSDGANVIDYDAFKCLSGSYYWNDSPEAHLIETSFKYLVNAGAGKTLKYESQTVTETLASGSNIKYKWASDDLGDYDTASFNASWLTAAELDAALTANNGSFSQYLYIKAQFNSTGGSAKLEYRLEWSEYPSGDDGILVDCNNTNIDTNIKIISINNNEIFAKAG